MNRGRGTAVCIHCFIKVLGKPMKMIFKSFDANCCCRSFQFQTTFNELIYVPKVVILLIKQFEKCPSNRKILYQVTVSELAPVHSATFYYLKPLQTISHFSILSFSQQCDSTCCFLLSAGASHQAR